MKEMIAIKSSNTILYCHNWKETVHFYKKLLNLPVITSLDWFVEFQITDTSRLSVADETKTTITSNYGKGITLTFEVEDLRFIRSNLDKNGLRYSTKTSRAWAARMIHVYDPEGNRVEFWASIHQL